MAADWKLMVCRAVVGLGLPQDLMEGLAGLIWALLPTVLGIVIR